MTRLELAALTEQQIEFATVTVDAVMAKYAAGDETPDAPALIALAGVQAQLATAAIGLARLL